MNKKNLQKSGFSIFFLSCLFAVIFSFSFSELNAQYKRNIIFEEFSEVWCGPCAALAPMLTKWLENHPDYVGIHYYSYFVVDGKKVMTESEDYNYRSNLYSVPFYPYARINAVLAPNASYPGYPTDTNQINYIIDTMTKTTPVKVTVTHKSGDASGIVDVNIKSDIDLTNKNLFVILVEKHRTYAKQSNGQTEFHHIFRKTLSGSSGEVFSLKAGESKDFSYNYNFTSDYSGEMIATVIVQDIFTRYIYQAESTSIVKSIENESINSSKLSIYPNPIIDVFNVEINSDDETITKIDLCDITGRVLNTIELDNSSNHLTLNRSEFSNKTIPSGTYFVKVYTNSNLYQSKIMIK